MKRDIFIPLQHCYVNTVGDDFNDRVLIDGWILTGRACNVSNFGAFLRFARRLKYRYGLKIDRVPEWVYVSKYWIKKR